MRKRRVVSHIDVWPVIATDVWRDDKPAASEFLGVIYDRLYAAESKPRWKNDALQAIQEPQ